MATTEIILTENIPGLGAEADLVRVKRGYARNYLLPTKRGYEVTPSNLRRLNQLKAKRAAREAEERGAAEEIARKIRKVRLNLTLQTGKKGKAFGSISSRDLEDALKLEIPTLVLERHAIQLERPIKETGSFDVSVRLYNEVSAEFTVIVKSANAEEESGESENAAE